MSRQKISTTIYVTPEQSDRLRLLHERTKVPVAVYIREGIDLVLRQYDHLLPGQLPLAAARAEVEPGPASSRDSTQGLPPGAGPTLAAAPLEEDGRAVDGLPGPAERARPSGEPKADRAAASKG